MPPGAEGEESYEDYILGTRDGVAKTPDWAEPITRRPARDDRPHRPRVRHDQARRPLPGLRHAAAGLRRAGRAGRLRAGGHHRQRRRSRRLGQRPRPPGARRRPVLDSSSPSARTRQGPASRASSGPRRSSGAGRWAEADGVRGVDRLDDGHQAASRPSPRNALINQHGNVNRTARDPRATRSKVEFLVVQDNFLTPTARFADLVLPACTQFETWGLEDGWKYGDEVILMPKLVEPLGESQERLPHLRRDRGAPGHRGGVHRGPRRARLGRLDRSTATARRASPSCPRSTSSSESNAGVYADAGDRAGRRLRRLPARPGGASAADTLGQDRDLLQARSTTWAGPDEIPAVPKYIQEWESPFGPEAAQVPAAGDRPPHPRPRPLDPREQRLAARRPSPSASSSTRSTPGARDRDGDPVRVFNDRGAVVVPCRVTPRILPGVVDIPQGAWWTPDEDGVDRRGSVNVLTSERWTPLAFGTAQHTIMVQVERAEAG